MRTTMNIHDKARQLVAQSPRPMELSEAYRQLAKRRRNYGRTTVRRTPDLAAIEPRAMRLPYRDD